MCYRATLDYGRQFHLATTAAGRHAVLEAVLADGSLPLHYQEVFLDWCENALGLDDPIEQIKWAQLEAERSRIRV